MICREDQTAPVSQLDIAKADTDKSKDELVRKIKDALNEKRDAYNGVVSSIVYLIDSRDTYLTNTLKDWLLPYLMTTPMPFGGKMFMSKALARLQIERPLFILDLFESVVALTERFWKYSPKISDRLSIQIMSLRAIKQAENSKGARPSSLPRGYIDLLCCDAILSCDDATKIDTLGLVLDSRSTTKVIEDRVFNLFKTVFQNSLSLQQPALRQILIATTGKLIKRIKDSHRVVMRDLKTFPEEEKKVITERYMQFLIWLIEFCLGSIYCNAYFGSFVLTISTLKLIIEHITFDDHNLPIQQFFNNQRCYDSILSCLNDSFEENKTLALELIFSLPYNDEFISEKNLACFETIAYELVKSVNPAHSLTCQFVFKLVVGLRSRQKGSTKTRNQFLLHHLTKLTDLVDEGIKDTAENLIYAMRSNAIYPKLTCIRALISEIDINELEKDREEWVVLAKRIISRSIEACKAVSMIVCNLNPETIGHLPMDLKPMDVEVLAKTLNVSLKLDTEKVNTISSQMLLISGWKTIKECSLSLGTLCTRLWWPKPGILAKKDKFPGIETPILDNESIINIIEFFDHYLRNLRHRGAFEQAYYGFNMVTKRVWHDEQFRDLLVKTLHQIMGNFKNEAIDKELEEKLKAHVTRRSAGLPFIVQAILNAEHPHDSRTLRWVMDCLFEVLGNKNSEEYQRIHCLNILKALIKETHLGEKVVPYIGETFAITLESFLSKSFPIQNCASMLLKATVDRTFGVNRLRHDIHRRNQLSFSRFFSDYKKLRPLMLNLLDDKNNHAAIHAVFIILFRLRPTLTDPGKLDSDPDSENCIKDFIERAYALAYYSDNFKLRELAARLTIQLDRLSSPKSDATTRGVGRRFVYLDRLEKVFSNSKNSNMHHGAVLLAKHVINELTEDTPNKEIYSELTERYFAKTLKIWDCDKGFKYHSIVYSEALNLVEACYLIDPNIYRWGRLLVTFVDTLHKTYRSRTDTVIDRFKICFIEEVTFRAIIVAYMASGYTMLEALLGSILDIITEQPDNIFSVNIQAALLRFIRQLLNKPGVDSFADELAKRIDLDTTVSLTTPFDKVENLGENDFERVPQFKFFHKGVSTCVLEDYIFKNLKRLFHLPSYREFKPVIVDDISRCCPSNTNSPRSIELLALACKIWKLFRLEDNLICINEKESRIDKLNYFTNFVTTLPDCDVKCFALLCAGKLMKYEFENFYGRTNDETVEALDKITQLIDNISDGDHMLILRETCAEILRQALPGLLKNQYLWLLQNSLVNLLSALIKLSHDEQPGPRLTSREIMMNLGERVHVGKDFEANFGSPLDRLINSITKELFDPSDIDELNNYFRLLIRVIFSHSKNYSIDVNEDRERLFDKTKVNTFADHIATVQSCLVGLEVLFERRKQHVNNKVDLNSLIIPQDVVNELGDDGYGSKLDVGDYSFRKSKVKEELIDDAMETSSQKVDSNEIVDQLIETTAKSVSYFFKGYSNILMDPDYTYHELILYKRIAFIKFVTQCTEHKLRNSRLVSDMKNELATIVTTSCSTTLLFKCLNMLQV